MNTHFYLADADGLIVSTGNCPDRYLHLQEKEGLMLIKGEASYVTQYVKDNTLHTYTDEELAIKTRLPRGHVWKMPERIAVDMRDPAQRRQDDILLVKINRAKAYPPIADLADALYWQSMGDDAKMDDYLAQCQAVKRQFPKVE